MERLDVVHSSVEGVFSHGRSRGFDWGSGLRHLCFRAVALLTYLKCSEEKRAVNDPRGWKRELQAYSVG